MHTVGPSHRAVVIKDPRALDEPGVTARTYYCLRFEASSPDPSRGLYVKISHRGSTHMLWIY